MQVLMLIEPMPGGGFRARVGEPLNLSADGPTESEAASRLVSLVNRELERGAKIATLTIVNGKATLEQGARNSEHGGYKFGTF
jgi:hypothetical protein